MIYPGHRTSRRSVGQGHAPALMASAAAWLG